MEPLEQQQGDQGCPNLNMEGVLGGADEAFDFEILLLLICIQIQIPKFIQCEDYTMPGCVGTLAVSQSADAEDNDA